MFSKLTLASLALSAVSAADMVLDTTVVSKWPYFTPSAADKGLTEIVKESQKIVGAKYTEGAAKGAYGCAQCIMMGLELWVAQTSAVGDQWMKAVEAAEVGKQNCCLPGYKLAAADSCDPTGTTQDTVGLKATYAVDKNSSRTWKTPEVALLQCPNDKVLCGATKVVTLVKDTASTLQFGAKTSGTALTKAKSNCTWLVKSACKPITIGYDAANSKAVSKIEDEFEVQWIQLPASAVTSDVVQEFTFTKDQLLGAAAVGSSLYDMTQMFSSGQTTAAFERMLPISIVELWVQQYNAGVKTYSDSLAAYNTAVSNFNLVHAPVAGLKADKEHATKLAAYLKTLPKMKTSDGSTDSTLPKLPERPSFTVERPLAWAGPTQIKKADKAKAAVDQFFPAMGAGSLLTGMLTLAEKKVQGYGTKGEDEKAKVLNYSVDAKGKLDGEDKCVATYLGVVARAKADGTAALALTVEEGTWTYPELAITAIPALPAGPAVREAAQYLAAGAASIALVAASLY